MSRIGNKVIEIPGGVTVTAANGSLTVKGPLGTMAHDIPNQLELAIEDGKRIVIKRLNESRIARSLHGLTRTLVNNMVVGVKQGFSKSLELSGVGYRVAMEGKNLNFQIGYTHPVVVVPPPGISFEVVGKNEIVIKGYDKQAIGQVAADIRYIREVEPYKGKGIKYKNEWVRRKAGKAGKAGAGVGAAAGGKA